MCALPQAVAFSEVMLECLSRPDPAVAESSLDYFLMLNTGAPGAELGRGGGVCVCLRTRGRGHVKGRAVWVGANGSRALSVK